MDPAELAQFDKLPLSAPPPGVVPNFVDPEFEGWHVYVTGSICLAITAVCVAFRLAAKISGKGLSKGWDDLVFVFAAAGNVVFIAIAIAACASGVFGRHAYDILLGQFTKEVLVLSLLTQALGPLFLLFIKLSLLVLYLQVFGLLRWMKWSVIVGGVIIAVFHIGCMIAFIVACGPRNGTTRIDYLTALTSTSCGDSRPLVFAQAVFNVIGDVYLIVLPLIAVWGLQMPVKKKMEISSMFLVGLIGIAAGILGAVYRMQLTLQDNYDNTWVTLTAWQAALGEMTAGILVCCMPSILVVVQACKDPFRSFISSSLRTMRLSAGTSSYSKQKDDSAIHMQGMSNGSGRKGGNEEMARVYAGPTKGAWGPAWAARADSGRSMSENDPHVISVQRSTQVVVSHKNA